MSAPARQRSLRERIQSASRGIGISFQGKKSKSYHSKDSLTEAQSSEGGNPENQNGEKLQPQSAEQIQTSDTSANEENTVEKKPLGRTLTQPQGTEQYQVGNSDTLGNIAARFDTTPSELAKLNRLAARIVFPGQLLFVPEKKNRDGDSDEKELSDNLHPPRGTEERRPSVTDALRIPYRRPSERSHRFLKVKARHFTDGQGIVSGVLIITPNAVMFDPNVSDPLVLEHGVESYGVIAPLDMLMRTAIYFDIAHMKVQNAAPDAPPRPKVEVYYGKMTDDVPELEESKACLQNQAPSIEVAPPTMVTPPTTPVQTEPPLLVQEEVLPAKEETKTAETTNDEVTAADGGQAASVDSVDSFDEEVSDAFAAVAQPEAQESRRERMLKRLSYPMESITSISRILTSSPKSFVEFSGSLFSSSGGRSSTEEEEMPKEDHRTYTNLVDEKPEIFETLDRLLSKQKEKEGSEGPPLYLCMRMGIPKERKPQASPVLSYGKKRARSEYWFSIPRSRVEDLYGFLQQWIPTLYGDVDEIDPDEAGFLLIDDTLADEEEEEGAEEEEGEKKEAPRSFLKLVEEHFGFTSISPGDWEVLSLGEMERIDLDDLELPLPDLLSPSDILGEDHIKELFPLLPARAVGFPWSRIFSTSYDGFHLKTLYRKMNDFDCPVVLAIQDDQGAVFGALLPVPLKPSDSFYGTGESFLFTFYPSFKVFRWTGKNDYFVRGNSDSISIGASEGHFGLWLDGDLYRGSSVNCQTYDNDTLAGSSDFIIQTLEAWGFS